MINAVQSSCCSVLVEVVHVIDCFALGLNVLPVNGQWRIHRSRPTDVRQVVNCPGEECVVLKVGAPYRREASITRLMDATLDKSVLHMDTTLDKSDRQSVTTGL